MTTTKMRHGGLVLVRASKKATGQGASESRPLPLLRRHVEHSYAICLHVVFVFPAPAHQEVGEPGDNRYVPGAGSGLYTEGDRRGRSPSPPSSIAAAAQCHDLAHLPPSPTQIICLDAEHLVLSGERDVPEHAVGRRRVDLLPRLGGHVHDSSGDHVDHAGHAPAVRGAEQVAVHAQGPMGRWIRLHLMTLPCRSTSRTSAKVTNTNHTLNPNYLTISNH